jgi:hypothetical protein
VRGVAVPAAALVAVAVSAVYICFCEHPKSQHKRERDGCRAVDCGCAKFEVDLKASAEVQGTELAPGIPSPAGFNLPGAGPALAQALTQLRRVEQERNNLLAHNEELVDVSRERDDARGERDVKQRQLKDALAALDLARAELAEAYGLVEQIPGRTPIEVLREVIAAGQDASVELKQHADAIAATRRSCNELAEADLENLLTDNESLRAELDEVRAERDAVLNDREATQRERNEARVEAIRLRAVLADVRAAASEKVRAVLAAAGDAAADEIYGYDAWSCMTDGGCGSRYTVPDPEHRCGRLTPVRVTITHRTEGAPPA